MKITFAVFVLVIIILQIQIIGLMWINHINLNVWNSQAQFNDTVIKVLSNQK